MIDENIILVTKELEVSPIGGRELLCRLNHDMLSEIYAEHFKVIELPNLPIKGFRSTFNAFKGHIDGLSDESISTILEEIASGHVNKVFVDGSNLGGIVKIIKNRYPKVQIYTFFHNVEARFFLGALRQTKTPHAVAVLLANFLAERKAVRFSDEIICLNERDSRLLKRVYSRSATHISAMALQDKLPKGLVVSKEEEHEKFALFVGGTFYANCAGIAWFGKHVAPRINIKTCVVGRGFEKFRGELEAEGKIEVIGEVDSLAKWYKDAQFVIAPIFDGSGMKTKVAEALMFGKKIIGTPEAFTGYEEIADRAGRVCRTADEFVDAIESIDKIVKVPFDPELREIYEKSYSYKAAKARIKSIMG